MLLPLPDSPSISDREPTRIPPPKRSATSLVPEVIVSTVVLTPSIYYIPLSPRIDTVSKIKLNVSKGHKQSQYQHKYSVNIQAF
jgi:hypothetical protein